MRQSSKWDIMIHEDGPAMTFELDEAMYGVPLTLGTFVSPDHLCPDLLRYEQIGAADNWRGKTVRAFFWLMRAWGVP